ncbi:MAG: pilus assembly FimT family protein [Candidatus Marinamargulisbacteria bacterium]
MIELLVVISLIGALLIVASPSFFGLFNGPLLRYDTENIIQHIRTLQSESLVNHEYNQLGFNDGTNTYNHWVYRQGQWHLIDTLYLNSDTTIQHLAGLNNTTHLIYTPNGRAHLCPSNMALDTCLDTPFTSTASIQIQSHENTIQIDFLPNSGYVSYNIIIQ